MESQLHYAANGNLATGTRYLNVARDLSRLNSKNEEITDMCMVTCANSLLMVEL